MERKKRKRIQKGQLIPSSRTKTTPTLAETRANDQKLYKEVWGSRPHYCEECGIGLGEEKRSIFMSHILTKKAHPELRHDPKNINLLCPDHHREWETKGNRTGMKVFYRNYPYMVTHGYVPSEKEENAWRDYNKDRGIGVNK